MKGTRGDTQKAVEEAAAAQRLARIVPSAPILSSSSGLVLDGPLLLSACRNTLLRSLGASDGVAPMRPTRTLHVQRFVCCRLNCESKEHQLYRSSISGAVQGVLGGSVVQPEDAHKDEEFVAGWMQSNSTSNSSIAQHAHTDDPLWSSRSLTLQKLEGRLNQLLQAYCSHYVDGDATCGASAFVSQNKRRGGAKEAEVDHATLHVDSIVLYERDMPTLDALRNSLFDAGWDQPTEPRTSRSLRSQYSTHHELELQFFSTKNSMVLNHNCEVRLRNLVPQSCATGMSSTHSWSFKEHCRPESHTYQDQRMLSADQSRESLDPINTMNVDRVAECILSTMQSTDASTAQDAIDSKIPFVMKQVTQQASQRGSGLPKC